MKTHGKTHVLYVCVCTVWRESCSVHTVIESPQNIRVRVQLQNAVVKPYCVWRNHIKNSKDWQPYSAAVCCVWMWPYILKSCLASMKNLLHPWNLSCTKRFFIVEKGSLDFSLDIRFFMESNDASMASLTVKSPLEPLFTRAYEVNTWFLWSTDSGCPNLLSKYQFLWSYLVR